jgi:hypothetical protein
MLEKHADLRPTPPKPTIEFSNSRNSSFSRNKPTIGVGGVGGGPYQPFFGFPSRPVLIPFGFPSSSSTSSSSPSVAAAATVNVSSATIQTLLDAVASDSQRIVHSILASNRIKINDRKITVAETGNRYKKKKISHNLFSELKVTLAVLVYFMFAQSLTMWICYNNC